jgi:hypothetical protein
MSRSIKIILSVLLFLCLFDWPYGYYQLVRFCAMAGFIYLAYEAFLEEQMVELIILLLLAILFQPLIKISLGRTLWNVVDVMVGIGLLFSAMRKKQE